MYIMEAIPTVLIGIVVFFYLTDRPAKANWLIAEERDWLTSASTHERRQIEAAARVSCCARSAIPKVMLLSLNYLGIVTASLGMLLFLPQIIK